MPRPSELLPLRQQSNDLADRVVDYLDLRPGQDALAAIEKEVQEKGEEAEPCVRAFWEEVSRDPPREVSGFVDVTGEGKGAAEERGRPEGAMLRNERFGVGGRSPSLEEGQAVFWRYSGGIFTALMHFSLAGELARHWFRVGPMLTFSALVQAASPLPISRPSCSPPAISLHPLATPLTVDSSKRLSSYSTP